MYDNQPRQCHQQIRMTHNERDRKTERETERKEERSRQRQTDKTCRHRPDTQRETVRHRQKQRQKDKRQRYRHRAHEHTSTAFAPVTPEQQRTFFGISLFCKDGRPVDRRHVTGVSRSVHGLGASD